MKKKLFFTLVLLLVVGCFFSFNTRLSINATEETDQAKVDAEIEKISVPTRAIIDFPVVSVSAYGSTINWVSSDTSTISVPTNGGWAHVVRADEDKTVTLTVTLTLGNVTAHKDFPVLVPKGTTVTNTYNINYVLNGGTNNTNNPASYTVGSNPEILNPTKGSVAFLGWYLDEGFTGSIVTSLPEGLSGEVTLYAKWAPTELVSISVKTAPNKVVYNAFESFDKTGLVVEASYNDGTKVEVSEYTVDKTVLHANDTYVLISFRNQSVQQNITVNKLNYDMTGISFVDTELVYTGSSQSLTITGELPTGLTVNYSGAGTTVGTYLVTATFVNADEVNYNTPTAKTATLTITKASYDMSGISFSDNTLTYNGLTQNLAVVGTLPEGVTVSYSEGLKNVGSKLVTATFAVTDTTNYNTPAPMSATLTISKQALTITAENKTMVYGHALPVNTVSYQGFVNNESIDNLSGSLVYTYKDSQGNIVTNPEDIGTYEIILSGLNSDNYNIIPVNGTLSIVSGSFYLYVNPADLIKVYNGENQTFTAVLKEGTEIITENVTINYTYNNAIFTGMTNAGSYEVVVDYEYGETGSETFTFVINKATIDMSGISFDNNSLVYNGSTQNLVITGTLPTGVEVSYSEGLKNVGSKLITATFTVADQANYNTVENMTATLTITTKALEASMFSSIPNQSHTGSAITPNVSGEFASTALVLGTDYSVVYNNNVEKGTANVVVTGLGNFAGSVTLNFTIGESDLAKVTSARNELLDLYSTTLNEIIDLTHDNLVLTINESQVFWMSTSTAVYVNATTGALEFIQTASDQEVTLYALITSGDAAEYVSFTFTIPEKGNDEIQLYQGDFEETDAHRANTSNSYSSNTYTTDEIEWNLTYADSVISGTPLDGEANILARVAKNTTNSPVIEMNNYLFGSTITKIEFKLKGNDTISYKVEYTSDGTNWLEANALTSCPTQTQDVSITLNNVTTKIKVRITLSVESSTGSNRDVQIDNICIFGTSGESIDTLSAPIISLDESTIS